MKTANFKRIPEDLQIYVSRLNELIRSSPGGMGSAAGGGAGGAAAPPQILEENFSIHPTPPPDFGGFCSEMF